MTTSLSNLSDDLSVKRHKKKVMIAEVFLNMETLMVNFQYINA